MTLKLTADDLAPGTRYDLGAYWVSRAEIIEVATRWDPQWFHIDELAASEGFFGDVIASGIHTLGILQRLMVDEVFNSWEVIAGRSMTDLLMTSPVRPDTEVWGEMVLESITQRDAERSVVHARATLLTGDVPNISYVMSVYVRRADARA